MNKNGSSFEDFGSIGTIFKLKNSCANSSSVLVKEKKSSLQMNQTQVKMNRFQVKYVYHIPIIFNLKVQK